MQRDEPRPRELDPHRVVQQPVQVREVQRRQHAEIELVFEWTRGGRRPRRSALRRQRRDRFAPESAQRDG
jgi:hypothetical protein